MNNINPNTLIHGDALTVLRQMESVSIDFIITDPPYGIDFQSNRPRSKDPAAKKPKIANDKSPFIWWLYDAFRVLTDGGAPLFQPVGCAAGIYRCNEDRRVFG